jgi:8-oxo-dGTP pyrophosphatase MutT (NUDIX family)
MPKSSAPYVQQSAVIPFRRRNGELEVLLITSSSSKRWVIPKGDKETELSPRESAAREALEEAGIEGMVSGESVGCYAYEKGGDLCRVRVFAMAVEVMHDTWEENYRQRRWLGLREAARRVDEKDLKRILRSLPEFVTAD